jgi:ABC-type transport system substrate-binding protein
MQGRRCLSGVQRPAARIVSQVARVTLSLVLVLAACGAPERTRPSYADPLRYGGTLEIVTEGINFTSLLSTSTAGTADYRVQSLFTRQLFMLPSPDDSAPRLAPDLAALVPSRANGGISADGRTYTIHLRSDVRWNGDPPRAFVAGDVVRAFRMLCNPVRPATTQAYYSDVVGYRSYCREFRRVAAKPASIREYVEHMPLAGVRAADDSTLVIMLERPAADFLEILSLPPLAPIPIEYLAYMPDGAQWRAHTMSLGPYQLVRYAPGRELVFARNPVWTAASDPLHVAYVDSVRIRLGLPLHSVQQEIDAGTADMNLDVFWPPATDLGRRERDARVAYVPVHGAAMWAMLMVNLQSPAGKGALRNVDVRRAISRAVNRDVIVRTMVGARVAQPLAQVAMEGGSGFDALLTVDAPQGDSAAARALLASAGVESLALKLGGAGSDMEGMAARLHYALGRAGIHVTRVAATSDWMTYMSADARARGVWDIWCCLYWGGDWFGANNGRSALQPLFDSRNDAGGTWNFSGYGQAHVDALIDSALASMDPATQQRYWQEVNRRVSADLPVIPLYQQRLIDFHSERVLNCVRRAVTAFWCDAANVALRGATRRTAR